MTRRGNSRLSQDETWKTMSRDSLETRYASEDSVTVSSPLWKRILNIGRQCYGKVVNKSTVAAFWPTMAMVACFFGATQY